MSSLSQNRHEAHTHEYNEQNIKASTFRASLTPIDQPSSHIITPPKSNLIESERQTRNSMTLSFHRHQKESLLIINPKMHDRSHQPLRQHSSITRVSLIHRRNYAPRAPQKQPEREAPQPEKSGRGGESA